MPSLSEAERGSLLQLARLSVTEAVLRDRLPEQLPLDGIFAEHRGVFVTLHVHSRLRGCIGVVEPSESLGEAIVRCAASAAKSDPRFPPMRPEDLPLLHVEVSLLSPLSPIAAEAVEIGKHGLLVVSEGYRGLLLPQVAVEHHLDREGFLGETCMKAGLPRESWRDPRTRLYGFTCEVFAEALPSASKVSP
jgi:AmmeMemoRadiSam system protein A